MFLSSIVFEEYMSLARYIRFFIIIVNLKGSGNLLL